MKNVWFSLGLCTLIICMASSCSSTSNLEKARAKESKEIISNCDLAARTEAARKYAQQASSLLRERINGDSNLDQGNLDAEFAKLYSGYEVLVQKEMGGEIVPSFQIVRKAKNGENEYRAFYTVNEEKALAARLRALEQAFKETTAAQKYANEIGNFVREGFKVKSID